MFKNSSLFYCTLGNYIIQILCNQKLCHLFRLENCNKIETLSVGGVVQQLYTLYFSESVQCSICGKQITSRNYLTTHINTVHLKVTLQTLPVGGG